MNINLKMSGTRCKPPGLSALEDESHLRSLPIAQSTKFLVNTTISSPFPQIKRQGAHSSLASYSRPYRRQKNQIRVTLTRSISRPLRILYHSTAFFRIRTPGRTAAHPFDTTHSHFRVYSLLLFPNPRKPCEKERFFSPS